MLIHVKYKPEPLQLIVKGEGYKVEASVVAEDPHGNLQELTPANPIEESDGETERSKLAAAVGPNATTTAILEALRKQQRMRGLPAPKPEILLRGLDLADVLLLFINALMIIHSLFRFPTMQDILQTEYWKYL